MARIGWSIPLPGPFYLAGTLWRSRRRRARTYHGTLADGWTCGHAHRTESAAEECARREQRRRRTS